ncbi:hypothetical protein BD779DRAFT_1179968 [Infundibulicybe gibba]|nr:hypothetical protein BD779DRAFT_1179968 [Infundibulicybe gibba]
MSRNKCRIRSSGAWVAHSELLLAHDVQGSFLLEDGHSSIAASVAANYIRRSPRLPAVPTRTSPTSLGFVRTMTIASLPQHPLATSTPPVVMPNHSQSTPALLDRPVDRKAPAPAKRRPPAILGLGVLTPDENDPRMAARSKSVGFERRLVVKAESSIGLGSHDELGDEKTSMQNSHDAPRYF